MRLVLVTQVLDRQDAVLGFVAGWAAALAARCERLRVLALAAGETSGLGSNVDLRVIGRRGRLGRYRRYRRFLAEAFGDDGFDTLLTHMVPRYSTLAAGPARRWGVGHFLWYTHGGVDGRLRRAVRVVDKVFTASPESMRVETEKKVVTGHGIDLEHFAPAGPPSPSPGPPRLVAVGRLTPAKDPLTLLEALARLRGEGRAVALDWAGGGLARGDDAYAAGVRSRIGELGLEDAVVLHGAVPYPQIPALLGRSTLAVSASRTGSVDKAVLEAMACALPVVTSNESFGAILAGLGEEAAGLTFQPGSAADLARRVGALLDRPAPERAALGTRLRSIVRDHHDLQTLADRLVAEMGGSGGEG